MAKFLTTSATNYYLEELIKNAKRYPVLISPYLKFNDRIVELLKDKDRLNVDTRILYGKRQHQSDEIKWMNQLKSPQILYCKNLHAKCYLSENECIITSLNLHLFSQINNNEMGIHLTRVDDYEPFRDAFEESRRLLRISKRIKITADQPVAVSPQRQQKNVHDDKLSSSRIAKKLGYTTDEFLRRLVNYGYLKLSDGSYQLTADGQAIGGEVRDSSRFGRYFLWPENAFRKPS